MNLTDLLADKRDRERDFFERPFHYGRQIKQQLRSELSDCRVFLFGSAVEGRATPGSDIDVLVFSPEMPSHQSERAHLVASLRELLGSVHPFELHFVDEEGLNWYRRFATLQEVSPDNGGRFERASR